MQSSTQKPLFVVSKLIQDMLIFICQIFENLAFFAAISLKIYFILVIDWLRISIWLKFFLVLVNSIKQKVPIIFKLLVRQYSDWLQRRNRTLPGLCSFYRYIISKLNLGADTNTLISRTLFMILSQYKIHWCVCTRRMAVNM